MLQTLPSENIFGFHLRLFARETTSVEETSLELIQKSFICIAALLFDSNEQFLVEFVQKRTSCAFLLRCDSVPNEYIFIYRRIVTLIICKIMSLDLETKQKNAIIMSLACDYLGLIQSCRRSANFKPITERLLQQASESLEEKDFVDAQSAKKWLNRRVFGMDSSQTYQYDSAMMRFAVLSTLIHRVNPHEIIQRANSNLQKNQI